MNAGHILSAAKWQYRLNCVLTVTGSGTNCVAYGSGNSTLENAFETSPFDATIGVLLEIVQSTGPTPQTGYSVAIPVLGFTYSDTVGSCDSPAELVVEFDNVVSYVVPATQNIHGTTLPTASVCFETKFSGGTVYQNGSSVDTFGGGTFKGLGLPLPYLIPAMIPVFGIGPLLNPFPSPSLIVTDPTMPYEGSCAVTLVATGGYRWYDGTTWHEPPVAFFPPALPTVSGNPFGSFGFSNPAFGSNIYDCGLTTYSNLVEKSFTLPAGQPSYLIRRSQTVGQFADLQIVPNCPRSIKRPTGYSAIWVRTGMPLVTGFGSAGWGYNVTSTDASLDVNDSGFANLVTNIYPRQTQDLAGVRDGVDPIEDTLSKPFYCPMNVSYQQGFFEDTPDNQTAHTPPDTLTTTSWNVGQIWNYPSTIDGITDNPTMNGYYVHANPLVTLWNFWGNPHWSYNLYFPGTPTGGPQSIWLVDGGASSRFYWQQTRDQLNYHPSLPPAQNTHTRTSNMLTSITETDLQPVMALYWNGNPWIGSTRFQVDKPTIPASVTPDSTSSASWSVSGGTIVVS